MNGHTKGPWRAVLMGKLHTVQTMSGAHITDYVIGDANARLIASAPDLLNAAQKAYDVLLSLDAVHSVRLSNQGTLCALRDSIAEATGQTSQFVQESAEQKAIVAKYPHLMESGK